MFGLDKFGGIGLHRIQRFMVAFGIDCERLSRRSMVITGTNGKGSTAHLAAAALRAHGLDVGLFTSPHMFDLQERFQLNGEQMPQGTFSRLADRVLTFNKGLPADDQLGAFQFLFLVALLWFEEAGPDAIVWEAGIGGRYDPVRMTRAAVGAVTSVELEHTEVLGGTEELIAYDKVDAVAPGGSVFLSPLVPPDLYERLETYCALAGRDLREISRTHSLEDPRNTAAGVAFTLSKTDHPPRHRQLRMIGLHQAYNAITADVLVEHWLNRVGHPYDVDRSWAGISSTQVPGRLQQVATDPDLWIDVGHTPAAVIGVIESYLEFAQPENTIVVLGVSSAKNVDGIAQPAAKAFHDVILTRAHRSGAPLDRLAAHFKAHEGIPALCEDISEAAALARQRAQAENKRVLAIGGLFLAAEFLTAWRGGDPAALEFL